MLLSAANAMATHFVDCTKGPAGSIVLTLPYPPSCNHIWKRAGNRVILDTKVAVFRQRVSAVVACLRKKGAIPSNPVEGKVAVMVEYDVPDKRRRDLDNGNKSLLDAITFSKLWKDDSQVVLMLTYFGYPSRNGACQVLIQPLEA